MTMSNVTAKYLSTLSETPEYRPSRTEQGRDILSLRISGGDDEIRVKRAANSMLEIKARPAATDGCARCKVPSLVSLLVRGCPEVWDRHHMARLNFMPLRIKVNVDELIAESSDQFALYGRIADHDTFLPNYPSLSLIGFNYSASYNTDVCRGTIYIDISRRQDE